MRVMVRDLGVEAEIVVATVVVAAVEVQRHRLTIDDELIRTPEFAHAIARHPRDALDVVDAGIGRKAKHHHLAARRSPPSDELQR